MKKKFGELHYGQWFTTGKDVYVKLQHKLPSGIPVVYNSFAAKDCGIHLGEPITQKGQQLNSKPFTAVDVDGIPGCVPEWLEVELIESPFPQHIKHFDNCPCTRE